MDILRKKYDQPKRLEQARIQAILELDAVSRTEDYKTLRQLYDQVNCLIHAVGNPSVVSDLNDTIHEALIKKIPLELQIATMTGFVKIHSI